MWVTIADNEYGWPKLLRLRVYYDGSPIPSVDAPIGDFFAVGHGFEAKVKSLDGREQLRRPGPQQLLADAVSQVLPDHGDQRGKTPRGEPLLPRRLGEGPVAAGEHAVLPRVVSPGAPGAGRRQQLRVPEREGQGPLRRNRALGRAGRGGLVRRGRRVLLGRRRGEALDRGDRQRGLLQRRLGPARQRRAVLRRDGRGRHGPRLAHDRVPVAPPRPGAVPEVAEVRHRAQGLDLQCRRLGQVGLRRARGPDVERGVLVPGGHRAGPAARALRLGAAAAGQRRADRGRAGGLRDPVREGKGHGVPGPLLVEGRRRVHRRGPGREG